MIIRVELLEFQYKINRFRVSIPELQIESGEYVAFVGPSGLVKTTLLKLLSGILNSQNGQINIEVFFLIH